MCTLIYLQILSKILHQQYGFVSFRERSCSNDGIFDGDGVAACIICVEGNTFSFLVDHMNCPDCVSSEVGVVRNVKSAIRHEISSLVQVYIQPAAGCLQEKVEGERILSFRQFNFSHALIVVATVTFLLDFCSIVCIEFAVIIRLS